MASTTDELSNSKRTTKRRVAVKKVNDDGTQQLVDLTGLASEELPGVVRLQNYGFSSVPPEGGEGMLLEIGGSADNAHVVGLEHKDFRPTKRKSGESILYDNQGQEIYISQKGIAISGGNNKLPLTITIGDSTVTIAKDSISLKASKIILDGTVYLGGTDASRPAAMQGTIDTAGNADVGNLSQKVFVK